jgi:predicted amidophosphoribosyltransferase
MKKQKTGERVSARLVSGEAFLRVWLKARPKENLYRQGECPACSLPVETDMAFCGHCGRANPNFNEEEFLLRNGAALEEVQTMRGCLAREKAAFIRNEAAFKYCVHCGDRH